MRFVETALQGAYVIETEPKEDERGMFARAFCQREFRQRGLKEDVAQCNLSYNISKGTLRGMHYQLPPHAEVKMVRCTRGGIYDVIIDIRRGSSSYLKWFGIELNSRNRRMLYVPEGFAHGYQALDDDSEVFYMVSQFYCPDFERGIRWNDPLFQITWPVAPPRMSPKDASHPDFRP